jgi:hypothetical protein
MQRPDASPVRPGVMRPASWLFQGHFRDRRVDRSKDAPPGCQMSAGAGGNAEENVVTPVIGRYIAGANPPAGPGPAALRYTPRIIGKVLPPRWVAAPGDADRTHRAGVFDDATPTEEIRDVMVPDAPDLKAIKFFPHSTASPADRSKAGLAARLGVLPQCRSACLSMPPTPRKPG